MQLQEMSWPAVAAVAKDVPVVVPIAAVEQHGHHLPVFTDSMLLGEVVRRAAEALGDQVIWTPLLWLGNSHHHLDFPGTLSAAPRTYLDVLGDLILEARAERAAGDGQHDRQRDAAAVDQDVAHHPELGHRLAELRVDDPAERLHDLFTGRHRDRA